MQLEAARSPQIDRLWAETQNRICGFTHLRLFGNPAAPPEMSVPGMATSSGVVGELRFRAIAVYD